ncbi:hypothetical protein ACHHYP_12141 [Achlya hypogyna]|uniref:Uncharacterized protein n=1 Tax=Achlya hypogyna TaxID=1202772 RepID=A0A1V9ZH62_ACHHY|nr:hypothetical protein ACHHYP_12141 [Achlya hypogyna]
MPEVDVPNVATRSQDHLGLMAMRLQQVISDLRHELRESVQLQAAAEEATVAQSLATAARNDELTQLLATAHANNTVLMEQVRAQRESLEDMRTRLQDEADARRRQASELAATREELAHEVRAKEDMKALLRTMVEAAKAPPPVCTEFRDVLDAPRRSLFHLKKPSAPKPAPGRLSSAELTWK